MALSADCSSFLCLCLALGSVAVVAVCDLLFAVLLGNGGLVDRRTDVRWWDWFGSVIDGAFIANRASFLLDGMVAGLDNEGGGVCFGNSFRRKVMDMGQTTRSYMFRCAFVPVHSL